VILQNLSANFSSQQDLFGDTDRVSKFEKIHNQIDMLESKFGKNTVYLASTKKALENSRSRSDAEEADRDLLFL
jgi:hypothetical protein